MDACGDPHALDSQRQSILDVANKTLSRDQLRPLAQEIQKTTGGALRSIGPSDQPIHKSSPCDGKNDGSIKRQLLVPNIDTPFDLEVGRFKCGYGERLSLRDETGFTLAPWVAHHPVCKQSNATDIISRIAPSDIAEDSISKPNSKNTFPTSYFKNHSAPDNQQDYSSVSSGAGTTLSSSPEELQTSGRLVTAATNPEVGVSPNSERASGSEKPPSTHMSYDPTESRSGILKLSIDSSPKQSLSQPTREGSLPRRRRTNRTEAQRIQEFHTDPYVAVIEPFRVLCALCNKWIKLRTSSRYCTIPWKRHKEGCTSAYGLSNVEVISSSAPSQHSLQDSQLHPNNSLGTQGVEGTTSSSTFYKLSVSDSSTASSSVAGKVNSSDLAAPSVPNVPPPSTIHPSLQLLRTGVLVHTRESLLKMAHANGPIRIRRSRVCDAEQRRTTLQNDPNAEIVESHRILCALCKRWVKLRSNSTYCSAPWHTHIRRCVHRQKRVNNTTGSTCGEYSKTSYNDNSNPDSPVDSHYHETCDAQGPDSVDGPVSLSRHNMSSSTLKDSSPSEQLKKQDGRPSRSTSLEIKHNTSEDDETASEMSYESEEQ